MPKQDWGRERKYQSSAGKHQKNFWVAATDQKAGGSNPSRRTKSAKPKGLALLFLLF